MENCSQMLLLLLIATTSLLYLPVSTGLDCPTDFPCNCTEEFLEDTNRTETILDCSNRNLTAIPPLSVFTGFTFDKFLLQNNNITTLSKEAFKYLTIRVINISNNHFSHVADKAFAGVSGLKELYLNNTGLAIVPWALRQLSTLEKLDLRNNKIRILPEGVFRVLRKLRYLDLSHNPVQFPSPFKSFDSLALLTHLKLSDCNLPNLPLDALQHLNNLRHLILKRNRIGAIPRGAFETSRKLLELDLEYNPVVLPSVEEGTFTGLAKLNTLVFTGCKLDRISKQLFRNTPRLQKLSFNSCGVKEIEDGSFEKLNRLEDLDIGGNNITLNSSIFRGLEGRLRSLGIQRLGLRNLPQSILEKFRKLSGLKADGNKIKIIKKDMFRYLKGKNPVISLDDNDIRQVSLGAFRGLAKPLRLMLRNNSITSLKFMEGEECTFDRAVVDVTNNPIFCDCRTYRLARKKIAEIRGVCAGPDPIYKGLKISPPFKEEADQNYIEKRLERECGEEPVYRTRYDCACAVWLDLDSPRYCSSSRSLGFGINSIVYLLVACILQLSLTF